jgi:hypothetical protein
LYCKNTSRSSAATSSEIDAKQAATAAVQSPDDPYLSRLSKFGYSTMCHLWADFTWPKKRVLVQRPIRAQLRRRERQRARQGFRKIIDTPHPN